MEEKEEARRPPSLSRFKVLDFTQAWAGPIATMMLADLGADVAKIEPPGIGDHVRKWTRPDLNGLSPYYLAANRNKKSIVIDLKRPEGVELALRLSEKADALVENFRPGTMDRLGVGYDAVSKRNPSIVYCSVSGYGASGPYADRAAYDLLVQGEGGLLSVTGQEDGTLAKIGVPIGDIMSANIAAFSIVSALLGREQTGKGAYIDISMLETVSMTMSLLLVDYALTGKKARPLGTANPLLAPYQVYSTATIPIVIGVLTEVHWKAFCEAIGRMDLFADERFKIAALRIANRAELNNYLFPVLVSRPAEEWIKLFSACGLACGSVNDVETLLSHPQHQARNFFQSFTEGEAGYTLPGPPWRITQEEQRAAAPPKQGEHTARILEDWLGISAGELSRLDNASIVATLRPGQN